MQDMEQSYLRFEPKAWHLPAASKALSHSFFPRGYLWGGGRGGGAQISYEKWSGGKDPQVDAAGPFSCTQVLHCQKSSWEQKVSGSRV